MNRARHIQSLVEFVLEPQAAVNARETLDFANKAPLTQAGTYVSDAVKHYTGIGRNEWEYGQSRNPLIGLSGNPHYNPYDIGSPHKEVSDMVRDGMSGLSKSWKAVSSPSSELKPPSTTSDSPFED